ncbi:MAG: 23S rRNA (adenine(2503)-C(2))-methyltransferase RlmN [Armatimonadota bacterium]|nr:23S rRNA (adenine(2503)-C(2))-methyltransferase RlmN [Armatimonadota bacterium]
MELLGATLTELQQYCEELDQPAFRGKQIAGWLYKKAVSDIDEMTDLPKPLRVRIGETATLSRARIVTETAASDGVRKFLLELPDGHRIESVLLPCPDRLTACVSTQVGCAAGCVFCASGELGLARNLTGGEIVDQVLTLRERANLPLTPSDTEGEPCSLPASGRVGEGSRDGHRKARVTNVVYMGVGEPLLNYENVVKSVRLLKDEVGISARHISVSTVGVTPRIRRLAAEKLQITLAISLHAPEDALRRELMPLAGRYPLAGLMKACRDYADTTGRRVTMEYLLLAGINDSTAQARQVAALLKGGLFNVNLIPYNPVPGSGYKRPRSAAVAAFRKTLEDAGLAVTQRFERGDAITAACGQLRRSKSDRIDGDGHPVS